MNDLEIAIVCFVNEVHRKIAYRQDKYQMLHKVKYKKEIDREYILLLRDKYKRKCLEAAYELKTYYMENGILSNTIVLKMRPESANAQEIRTIKIHSESYNVDFEYTHHAIEVFKEHGKYKVLDILHTDKVVFLEEYLDDVCKANDCQRNQLRYDLGMLTPCHAFAGNMQEFSDVMRYLDKKYRIGKPRVSLMNVPKFEESSIILSDDIIMDFDEFGKFFNADYERVKNTWIRVYDRLTTIRLNILHMLCLEHIMGDPIISAVIVENLFDDAKICQLMEEIL